MSSSRHPLMALVAGLVLVTASCAGESNDETAPGSSPSATTVTSAVTAGEPTPSTTTAAVPTAVATTAPTAETAPATPAPTTSPPTSTAPAVVEDPGVADELGLGPVVLLTAASGGGGRPILAWEPVDGAAFYHVVVLGPDGRTYWGTRTAEAEVPVGGVPRLSEDAAGPSISEGMSWSVMALDASGDPIALSGRRPIAP